MPVRFKLALGLVAGGLLFSAGYYSRGEVVREVPHDVVKTEVQTKEVEKIVNHTQVKTVTVVKKEPSGATTTTTTKDVTTTATTNEAHTVDKEQQRTEPLAASQANYSVGLGWQPRAAPDAYVPTRVEFGRRLIGPVWGEVGADWRDHSLTVGVRAEW